MSTFCVAGTIPRIPRSNCRSIWHEEGVTLEKEKGREPARLERILCSHVTGFENVTSFNPCRLSGRQGFQEQRNWCIRVTKLIKAAFQSGLGKQEINQ